MQKNISPGRSLDVARDDKGQGRGTDRKIIAIVGPTASGKTAVGVKLAKEFNGEIVSADSRQIFRGLDIGTGKDLKEYDDVVYHMIDICDPEEEFNLFEYLKQARAAIEDILSRGKLPIIVGGTGLYVQALIEGFELKIQETRYKKQTKFQISNSKYQINSKLKILNSKQLHGVIPDLIRDLETIIDSGSQASVRNDRRSREQLEKSTISELQAILQEIDPKAFDDLADKKNPHRLIRAIERAQSGEAMTKVKPNFEALQIGLEWPREELNRRIDKRVDDRFNEGMLREIIGLLQKGVDTDWLLKLGLEYRIITDFVISNYKFLISNQVINSNDLNIKNSNLNKNLELKIMNSLEFRQMAEELKVKSHQYAKRQMTWFKRFPEIIWLNDYKDIERRVKEFLN